MNLALQKRHEQLERWRQNEEQAERLQRERENEENNQKKANIASRSKQSVQQLRFTRGGTNRNISTLSNQKCTSVEEEEEDEKSSKSTNHKRLSSSQAGSRVKFTQSTLFLNACANADLDECKRMLEAKLVDINTTTCDGLTGLHEASICANADMVEYLIKQGANIDCCDNEGWTPLHAAASLGQTKIVELLLKHGASVTIVNCENFLAYDLARNDQVRELIGEHMRDYDIDQLRRQEELMIEQDIERWIKTGQYEERSHPTTQATVLHVLAAKGYLKLMKRLLEALNMKKQINLEARDSEGFTPLLAASFWNQAEIVELLIEHGANIFAQANSGYKISSIVSIIMQLSSSFQLQCRVLLSVIRMKLAREAAIAARCASRLCVSFRELRVGQQCKVKLKAAFASLQPVSASRQQQQQQRCSTCVGKERATRVIDLGEAGRKVRGH